MKKVNAGTGRISLIGLLSLMIILTRINLNSGKIFKYYSYTEILEIFENLALTCSQYVKIDYAQDRYGFPHSAGSCDGKPCKNLIVFMTDFTSLTADRPQIFISGLLHGDEVVGGNMLTELALFYCNDPQSKNPNVDYVKELLSKRYFVFEPLTNPYGYANNIREELVHVNDGSTTLIDPNRDFSFFDNFSDSSTECMQTITARTVNELFREHLFLQSLTFHGGINAIGYPWGNYVHQNGSKSRECPDYYAGITIGQVLQNYSDSKTNTSIERYFLGDMIEMSYPIDGGMEDWAYSASWENTAVNYKKPIKKCNPYTYSGYDASRTVYDEVSIRSMVFIVECFFSKRPNASSLGNDEIYIFNEKFDFYGHIARNMRIVTSTADLAYPYVLFNFIDYEKSYVQYNLMGCITAESSKAYSLKLSLNELKSFSLDNWGRLRNSVDGNKIKVVSEVNSKECKQINFVSFTIIFLGYWKNQNSQNSNIQYFYDASTVNTEITKFFLENKKTLYSSLSSALPDGFSLNTLLVELNTPDKNWSAQKSPDPLVAPQTHLIRLRSTENYSATNQNFSIKGDKFFYSNLFLFNSKNSAFELDNLDAFFFDTETFKLNFHFLNAFRSSSSNSTINTALFGNINLSNYIRTQILINRLIPSQTQIAANNPMKSSNWLFEVFLVYIIDENFEQNILNANNSNNSNGDTDYIYEKSINGEMTFDSPLIDNSNIAVLDNLINERNYFDFQKFENTKLDKVNFNILFSDPLDVNIRYGEQQAGLNKDQKLKKGKKNTFLNSACYEITSLNLHLGSLKNSERIYLCKLTSEASNFNSIKNTLFQAFYSIEFLSKSSNFIYKILSLPSLESNATLPAKGLSFYSPKSKYFTKSAFCLNKNTNLNSFALNKKEISDRTKNNFVAGSGILLLYQLLFEQGRNTIFESNLNSNTNYPSVNKQNFMLLVTKKSNLILAIKIFSLIPSAEVKITKISFTQNFNFFVNTKSKDATAPHFYLDPISFSISNQSLINTNNYYYFEMKVLDLNILGKNFLYRIEYTTNINNSTSGENKTFDSSCVLIEEIKADENFQKFFKQFDYEGLNTFAMNTSSGDNTGMIAGIIVGFVAAIGLIVLFILWRRKKRTGNTSVKSIQGQKTVYNNLEFGVNIISRDSITNNNNNKPLSK